MLACHAAVKPGRPGGSGSGIMEGNELGCTLQLGDTQVDEDKLAELSRRYEVKRALPVWISRARGDAARQRYRRNG